MADNNAPVDPALAISLNQAFGPTQTEAQARKKRAKENDDAEDSASAWDTINGMAGDAAAGFKDLATNPKSVWNTVTK